MAQGLNQHVTPRSDGRWQVISAGGKKATAVTQTKNSAITIGRKIAQNQHSELVIHGKNGRIQKKDSHGHDPFPPRG